MEELNIGQHTSASPDASTEEQKATPKGPASNFLAKAPPTSLIAVVCTTVLLLSLWNTVDYFRQSAGQITPGDLYGIAQRHPRLAELASAIDVHERLGYLEDPLANGLEREILFCDVRFEVAPRFVVRDSGRPAEFLVGNFAHILDFNALARAQGLQVVHDFGAGVVLFRRTDSR